MIGIIDYCYVGYIYGKNMKIKVPREGTTMDTHEYNRHSGGGAGERTLERLRNRNEPIRSYPSDCCCHGKNLTERSQKDPETKGKQKISSKIQ